MTTAVAIFLICLVVFIAVGITTWIIVSRSAYTARLLMPGDRYSVSGRHYTMPNIPITGNAYMLKPHIIDTLRTLLVKTRKVLRDMDISCWPTGGSLLGTARHQAVPMPFDDDVDIAVDFSQRERLYDDPEFQQRCMEEGLRVIYLLANGSASADRHGSAVRVQMLHGSSFATLDVFFWKRDDNLRIVSKVDGWTRDKVVLSANESFPIADVYPLQRNVAVDGIALDLPANPQALLEKQYGSSVMHHVVTRPLLISHAFPFLVLNWIWRPKPSNSIRGYRKNKNSKVS